MRKTLERIKNKIEKYSRKHYTLYTYNYQNRDNFIIESAVLYQIINFSEKKSFAVFMSARLEFQISYMHRSCLPDCPYVSVMT